MARKSKKRLQNKRRTPKRAALQSVFDCLKCEHPEAVSVSVRKKEGLGSLSCTYCKARYSCRVCYISKPIDVYYEWMDKLDADKTSGSTSTTTAATTTAATTQVIRSTKAKQKPQGRSLASGSLDRKEGKEDLSSNGDGESCVDTM
ncbi:uncharacterized protein PV07_12571 [Cladophialophora immunda]|uniref:Transcription elongation factor 1 homolog n=1 Tax=Cladophialophora immunda TaxID=569365 RepID=A0A0D1Z354_9EURO|nr:uncharacterized protein PV07_12571 [Cladophialophora immunda]KIW22031.1 hypothetical protein PV07_12571 [Cladophialophora immunda]